MTRPIVIGTAGHIDHGKTALVRALTGTDTDRLAEEKRRGITIDLGFARLPLPDGSVASVIDVPGHEDFIRNMVAGATGIDVALLVVAADEGVMPQTREHVTILRMLGVEQVVVALTKCDLVDDDFLQLAAEDLRAYLAGTPYRDAPIVNVSVRNGAGLGALVSALGAAAAGPQSDAGFGLLRMPIDRAFTVRGTGTVVTGTLRDGSVAPGDALVILPRGIETRVRAVQHHGEPVPMASAGMRAALALVGVDRGDVGRGNWVTSGGWPLSSILTARVELDAETARPLRDRQRMRVHIGTAEIIARVVLLEEAVLEPGRAAFAQLRLESPVVARRGDRFVLRSWSPIATIGGGLVLEPLAAKRRRLQDSEARFLDRLASDPAAALVPLVEAAGWSGVAHGELPLRLGGSTTTTPLPAAVVNLGDRLVASRLMEQATETLRNAIAKWQEKHPLRPGMELSEARRLLGTLDAHSVDRVIERAAARGLVERRQGWLTLPGFRAAANPSQTEARSALEVLYREAGFTPPRLDELPAPLGGRADLRDLIALLEREGALRPFPPDRYIHREALEQARQRLGSLAGGSGLGPADFRTAFNLPRKPLIPLLELFDRLGWTRREGDRRSVPQDAVVANLSVP